MQKNPNSLSCIQTNGHEKEFYVEISPTGKKSCSQWGRSAHF